MGACRLPGGSIGVAWGDSLGVVLGINLSKLVQNCLKWLKLVSDVVIDPIRTAEDSDSEVDPDRIIPSPRKSSLGPRLPVIPPSSVKITPDGNLACKLEALSGQAEAKLKEIAELERQQIQNCPKSNLQPDKR